jgi:D-alanyl-D-alanine dipeptidase
MALLLPALPPAPALASVAELPAEPAVPASVAVPEVMPFDEEASVMELPAVLAAVVPLVDEVLLQALVRATAAVRIMREVTFIAFRAKQLNIKHRLRPQRRYVCIFLTQQLQFIYLANWLDAGFPLYGRTCSRQLLPGVPC